MTHQHIAAALKRIEPKRPSRSLNGIGMTPKSASERRFALQPSRLLTDHLPSTASLLRTASRRVVPASRIKDNSVWFGEWKHGSSSRGSTQLERPSAGNTGMVGGVAGQHSRFGAGLVHRQRVPALAWGDSSPQ